MIDSKPHYKKNLISNNTKLWVCLIQIIGLFLLLSSTSCYCTNPHPALLGSHQGVIIFKVDKEHLQGHDKTFQLTLKNTSTQPIKLPDYQLRVTANEQGLISNSIRYKNDQGEERALCVNALLGEFLPNLTTQKVLEPGQELYLPAFELQLDLDKNTDELAITFGLYNMLDKQASASKTITWNVCTHDLCFQQLHDLIGTESLQFTIKNTSKKAIDLKKIKIELQSSNQASFTLGPQIETNLELGSTEILSALNNTLQPNEETQPGTSLTLQNDPPHEVTEAKVSLYLFDKEGKKIDRKSIIWYRYPLDLVGAYKFTDESNKFCLNSINPQLDPTKVTVYIESIEEGFQYTLNEKPVNKAGISLATILKNPNPLLEKSQEIDLKVTYNGKATEAKIILKCKYETGTIILNKKIDWVNYDTIFMESQKNKPFFGSVLKCLKEGSTLKNINEKSFIKKKLGNGESILYEAIEMGQGLVIIDVLIQKGIDVNATTNKGSTALHLAALQGKEEIVKRLLAANASINSKDINDKTALSLARDNKHTAVVALLKAAAKSQRK